MALITYADKTAMNANPSVPAINKCRAEDMNEIKSVVNGNWQSLQNIISQANNSGVINIGNIGIEWGTGSITSGSSETSGLYGGSTTVQFQNTYAYNPVTIPCWGGSYINQVDIYSLTGTTTSTTVGGHLTSASSTRVFRYFTFGILANN